MKPIKQMLCWMLAVLCLAGCCSGCQKEEAIVTEAVPTQSSGAMGRYVEQSIPLPECQYAEDLVMLDDGRLRVALRRTDGSVMVCTSGADRTTWADTWEIPGAITSTGDVAQMRRILQQAGNRKERRFSLPSIHLPRPHLPHLDGPTWATLLMILAGLLLLWLAWGGGWSKLSLLLP